MIAQRRLRRLGLAFLVGTVCVGVGCGLDVAGTLDLGARQGPDAGSGADAADGSGPAEDAAASDAEVTLDGGVDAAADGGCKVGCPIAVYDFDEGTGDVILDTSGKANNGVIRNGAVRGTGHAGAGMDFDGLDDWVEFPASASLNITGTGLTILFWVKIDDTKVDSVDHVLLGKPFSSVMTEPYYQYGVEFDANGTKDLDFYFTVGAGTLQGPFKAKPVLGKWTHAAFTYDGAAVKGYIDGVLVRTAAASGAIVSRPSTGLRLGVDADAEQELKGALDAIRIFPRALTIAEIVAIRNGT